MFIAAHMVRLWFFPLFFFFYVVTLQQKIPVSTTVSTHFSWNIVQPTDSKVYVSALQVPSPFKACAVVTKPPSTKCSVLDYHFEQVRFPFDWKQSLSHISFHISSWGVKEHFAPMVRDHSEVWKLVPIAVNGRWFPESHKVVICTNTVGSHATNYIWLFLIYILAYSWCADSRFKSYNSLTVLLSSLEGWEQSNIPICNKHLAVSRGTVSALDYFLSISPKKRGL